VKILPLKCLLFNRYSLQSVTICENFPLEKLGIAQLMKIFPLENNPLYSTLLELRCFHSLIQIYKFLHGISPCLFHLFHYAKDVTTRQGCNPHC